MTIGIGLDKIAALNAGTVLIVQNKLPKIEMAHVLLEQVDSMTISLRNMMLDADEGYRERQMQAITASRAQVAAILEKMRYAMITPDGQKLMHAILESRDKYAQGQGQLLALIHGGKEAEAKAYLTNELRPVLNAFVIR